VAPPSVSRPQDRVAPYTGSVEIRVHGVSGTPPEELLGRRDVRQVAGDRLSGFYRPSLLGQMRDEPPPDQPPDRPPDDEAPLDRALPDRRGWRAGTHGGLGAAAVRGPWLEGYSWGGWTSGARSRVLWLVLLPFALVNVSSRMLPPEPGGDGVARRLRLAAAALLRVLALSLTVTMVQGAVGVAVVTVALRCGTEPGAVGACHGLPSFVTDLLGRLPAEGSVLLCAAVPLAVTGLLWLVSHRASARYENAPDRPPPGRPDDAPQPLLRPDLWQSGPAISRLRLLHVQAGIVSVVASASWVLSGGVVRTVTGWLSLATVVITVVLVARRPAPPYTAGRRGRIMLPARLTWIPLGASVVALGWQVAPGLAGRGGSVAGTVLADAAVRRADVLVQDLFVGQAVLLAAIALLVGAARIAGAGRGRAMFVSGFAGFVVAMLAWLTGAMLTASVLVLAPAWLARPGFAVTPRQLATALADPATAGWFGDTTRSSGVGTAVGVGVLLVLVLQLAVRAAWAARIGGAGQDRAAVRTDYPDRAAGTDPESRSRARSIATMFWSARRVDGLPRAMATLCLAIAVLLAAQGLALLTAPAPSGWQATVLGRVPPQCRAAVGTGLCSHVGVVAWGVFCTAGLGVLVLIAGVLAYRTPAARRGVGVFWDLACFWPRDTHPLAPPCYNERIMPQVSVRVAWYLGTDRQPGAADPAAVPDDRGRVVLAGHSQGSVIALAAALIQPAAARRRLALVTVGCVLDRLYSRFFPRYFGPELYRLAAQMLGPAETVQGRSVSADPGRVDSGNIDPGGLGTRWVNIWRHSDYLGGAVPHPPSDEAATGPDRPPAASGPENLRSVDPAFDPEPGDTVWPAPRRHSDFWTDSAFLPAIRRLLRWIEADTARSGSADLQYGHPPPPVDALQSHGDRPDLRGAPEHRG